MSENVIYSINGPVVKVKSQRLFNVRNGLCWSC